MPALFLEFKSGQDINDIQDEYEVRLYVAMVNYFEDPKRIEAFRNDFRAAVNDAFILAFIAGKADAGNGDPLTEDETDWINAKIGAEIGFADTLWVNMRALHGSDDYTPADGEEFAATHAVNYASTLAGIYSEGKLFGARNKFLTFDGDDGAESCQTCQSLKGRRKTAKWWLEQELVPGQQGNTNFICGGWQCQHYLVDDDGVIYAGYGSLDWAGESAWGGKPAPLFAEFVEFMLKEGGPGSGNFGHGGRPGEIGGSGPGDGSFSGSNEDLKVSINPSDYIDNPDAMPDSMANSSDGGPGRSIQYHGSSQRFDKLEGDVVYITPDDEEARGYALDSHRPGVNTKQGYIYKIRRAPGETLNISRALDEGMALDDDPNDIIDAFIAAAREAGYSYLYFEHPSFVGGVQRVVISLNPNGDLRIVGRDRVK